MVYVQQPVCSPACDGFLKFVGVMTGSGILSAPTEKQQSLLCVKRCLLASCEAQESNFAQAKNDMEFSYINLEMTFFLIFWGGSRKTF